MPYFKTLFIYQIKELEARLFKDCHKLRELSLSFNQLSRIDSEAFRNVGDTLESLEISFGFQAGITEFPGRGLRPLVKLLWLALGGIHKPCGQ